MKSLSEIQAKVKAPKGQFNSFGKYKYRSAEDILEAVKQVINPMGFYVTISDEIINIGDRYYVKATATLSNGEETYTTTALAREEESKKGMDGSQVTGASSSYSRKYALNGLFALDDTQDADATNTHGKSEPAPQVKKPMIDTADIELGVSVSATIEDLQKYFKYANDNFELSKEQIAIFSNRKSELNK